MADNPIPNQSVADNSIPKLPIADIPIPTPIPEIHVRSTKGMTLVVDVTINGSETEAVIDTAAMVTLVSDSFFRSLACHNTLSGQTVLLKGLSDTPIHGQFFNGLNIRIGHQNYKWKVCVAPMTDNCILGIDFLKAHSCLVDLGKNLLSIGGQHIPAKLKIAPHENPIKISRVQVAHRSTIPPHTIGLVQGKIHQPTPDHQLFEPLPQRESVLMSSVYTADHIFNVKVINDSDRYLSFKKGRLLGLSEPCMPLPESHVPHTQSYDVNIVQQDTPAQIPDHTPPSPPLDQLPMANEPPADITLPDHLTDLYNSSCDGLEEHQQLQLKQLLYNYSDVFARDDMDLGCLHGVYHHIDTGDAAPINEKVRRTPLGFQDLERDHIQKLLEAGVIQPSASEWASAPVLVRKKCGAVRYCLDYRKLNNLTIKDRFPLPNISDCLDTLQGTTLFSTLDLAMGYYQLMIHPDSQHKTAFITKFGQFSHIRLGFGLCNAPATFQRAIQLVLRGFLWEEVLAYLDDIIVLGRDFSDALLNLSKVLERFRSHNLKLKPIKCKLLKKQVKFLGKLVTEQGISIDPSKLEAVDSWPVPTNQTELQSFLGFINYHRDHIQNFAQIASPLYDLSTQKGSITLSDEHLEVFESLKQTVTSAECLSFPTPDGLFILDTDASSTAIGAELSQVQNGVIKPICYASNTLLKAQRNYCTTRKELLSVVKFCRHFRHYLLGRRFLLRTDHNSLVWLTRFKEIQGQLARWLEELSQFDMDIVHRDGKKHINCDALSRIPDPLEPCDCYNAGLSPESLPCGGCPYCTRA
ncbi:MAG: pol polyprotein, partial [Sedimenticola sp.]